MTQLEKVKVYLKCEKVMKSCKHSGHSVTANNYIDLAKRKGYITDKQYEHLRKL